MVLGIALGLALALAPFMTRASRTDSGHLATQRAQAQRGRSGAGRLSHHGASRRLSAATTVLAFAPPPIQARAAFLIDLTSHRVLYAKNADARLPMASTTKITTAALVLAHARLTDLVTVSNRAATIGESTMSLVKGERLSVKDLLYGLLLNSGNDAAIALAEHVGGSVRKFVRMMNELARALGMRNTHYATPHGLDAPHHYTSARDLATVALYAMRDPTFRRIVATTEYHIPATKHNHEHWLGNINRVMYWFPGVDGVKPGDTDDAGLCQVVSDWRGGRHLLAVLLNTPTLWIDIRNLLDYGSRDFRWVQAPVWSDGPADAISGEKGARAWTYFFGAGHYVRGDLLRYFNAHGGLTTLGYPRTEALTVGGRKVQYFQGGELIDQGHDGMVVPVPLGASLARRLAPRALWPGGHVTPGFAGAYRAFGGAGVLGPVETGTARLGGYTVQIFRYGAIAEVRGAPALVPLGDLALRQRGWLPAVGSGDAFPSTLSASVVPALSG